MFKPTTPSSRDDLLVVTFAHGAPVSMVGRIELQRLDDARSLPRIQIRRRNFAQPWPIFHSRMIPVHSSSPRNTGVHCMRRASCTAPSRDSRSSAKRSTMASVSGARAIAAIGLVWHGGGLVGWGALMTLLPDFGIGVAFLTNRSPSKMPTTLTWYFIGRRPRADQLARALPQATRTSHCPDAGRQERAGEGPSHKYATGTRPCGLHR